MSSGGTMKHVPRGAVIVAMLLVTAACSSTPVYSHDQACSMDAMLVSRLLGSDRITADDEQLTGTPLAASYAGGPTLCSADRGDNRLVVEALIVDQATAASEKAGAKQSSTSFEYRGGFGDTTAKGVTWTCGNVRVRIFLLEEPQTQPDWQQLAEPVWDQVGCLTYSSPGGEASQPEGWS